MIASNFRFFAVTFQSEATCTIVWHFLSHSLAHRGHAAPLTSNFAKVLKRLNPTQMVELALIADVAPTHRYLPNGYVYIVIILKLRNALKLARKTFGEDIYIEHKTLQNIR